MRHDHRGRRRVTTLAGILLAACALIAACSSDSTNKVTAAQTRVTQAEKGVTDAQAAFDKATAQFCGDTKDYVLALDRYGKAFDQSAATVGDIKTVGADLENPRATVVSSAEAVPPARDDLAKAKQELADAQAALAAAQASAASQTLPSTTAPSTTTTAPLVPPETVDRVKKAEADFTAATQGVTDQTPLTQATVQVNSAALALQVAWLQLFNQAGCFSDEQHQKAATALQDYTASLQTALHTTGFYNGEIDGVYGPSTAEAVQQLQTKHALPTTGWVDRATANALDAELLASGGAAATQALTHTAAVQSTLKLAGYWTGPVDGQWTPELTTALMNFQTALGVPPTGSVDAATLAAFQQVIANAQSAASTTTTSTPQTSTTINETTTSQSS